MSYRFNFLAFALMSFVFGGGKSALADCSGVPLGGRSGCELVAGKYDAWEKPKTKKGNPCPPSVTNPIRGDFHNRMYRNCYKPVIGGYYPAWDHGATLIYGKACSEAELHEAKRETHKKCAEYSGD